MSQVDQIKSEIESLSEEDFAQLREWLAKRDWALWDEKIEKDIVAGKLESLREEAATAKTKGQLSEL